MAQAKSEVGNKGIKRHLKKKNQKKTSIGLNENFYSELLYILGLEERKTKNKKTISASDNPQSGSLYENIKTKLLIG